MTAALQTRNRNGWPIARPERDDVGGAASPPVGRVEEDSAREPVEDTFVGRTSAKPTAQGAEARAVPSRSTPITTRTLAQLQVQSRPSVRARLVSAHHLRLANTKETVLIPASNYLLDAKGEPRPEFAEIARVVLERSPERQAVLDARITAAHSEREMSFQVKNHESGRYDKTFSVPVQGVVVPFRRAHFDMLVRSSGPVMRVLRDMLQRIYSKPGFTAEDLGLGALPEHEQDRILESIRTSVYFEPKLVAPVMKDYPFLTVAGFDAAVGDLEAPTPTFFEYNLGTPSGLSNNVQLLESLRTIDPELFSSFEARIPKDDTFALLRQALESNAAAWTKRSDGISVVVGPGPYNGAHPDVASIAEMTKMPRVSLSHLYEDANGDIRLNTGAAGGDPLVTGIYGRMEESYFLQSNEDGIPIRGPGIDNSELAKKTGLPLEQNVRYWELYDDQNKAVGVVCDAQGKPLYQPVWGESMGRDPARPDAPRGSFVKAVLNRKLYYSGLGGRVVDDKRVFQAIAHHVAPKVAAPGAPIASPPRTLELNEYASFYSSEHPERYVVKEPDNSGGVGVYLLVNLTEAERKHVVELVKADPHRYIVQEFAKPAVLLAPERAEDGSHVLGTLANDLRVFVMMDAAGEVHGGPNSLLLRVARRMSASTNTSQGAGYGIMAVLEDAPGEAPSAIVHRGQQDHVPAGRRADLRHFLEALSTLTQLVHPDSNARAEQQAAELAQMHRDLMDVLGGEYSSLMTACRRYAEGGPKAELHEALLAFRLKALESDTFASKGIAEDVHEALIGAPLKQWSGRADRSRDAARAAVELEPFDAPRLHDTMTFGTDRVERVELGRIVRCPDPEIQAVIDALGTLGGEMRMHRIRTPGEKDLLPYFISADLRFEDGKPIISVDPGQELFRAGVAHEWAVLGWVLEAARQESGQGALERAIARWETPKGLVAATRAGVDAELATEAKETPDWNEASFAMPRRPRDLGFATRVTYPEYRGLKQLLADAKDKGAKVDEGLALELLSSMLERGHAVVEEGKKDLEAALARLVRTRSPNKAAVLEVQADLAAMRRTSTFDHLFGSGLADSFENGTRGELERLFRIAESEWTRGRARA